MNWIFKAIHAAIWATATLIMIAIGCIAVYAVATGLYNVFFHILPNA